MSDTPFGTERAPRKPLPHCKAILLCEEVHFDGEELATQFLDAEIANDGEA